MSSSPGSLLDGLPGASWRSGWKAVNWYLRTSPMAAASTVDPAVSLPEADPRRQDVADCRAVLMSQGVEPDALAGFRETGLSTGTVLLALYAGLSADAAEECGGDLLLLMTLAGLRGYTVMVTKCCRTPEAMLGIGKWGCAVCALRETPSPTESALSEPAPEPKPVRVLDLSGSQHPAPTA